MQAGSVQALTFSPDGKTLAAGGTDQAVTLWEVATGKRLAQIGDRPGPVLAIAFSPDGKALAKNVVSAPS